jgi:methionine synthase I (cobalamin-dependent)
MISAAVGRGGETMISAQTIEAYWNAMKHVKPISIGLNCSLGPGSHAPVPRGTRREIQHGHLLLSERGPAESALADGL